MKKSLLPFLALLAVAQTALLWSVGGASPVAEIPGPGDRIGDVVASDAWGMLTSLVTEQPTLLLVFHSECVHCRAVAPTWRSWLQDHRDALAVVALSAEPRASAEGYVMEQGWDVDVRTLPKPVRGTREHWLTSRTPWLFALDRNGHIVAEGHGSLIGEIGGVLIDPASKGADE